MFKAIFEALKPLLSFFKSVYSDNGVGSSTRVHIGILVTFVVAVGLSFAAAVHLHKVTIEQFNSFLASGATFLTTTCGSLYGANQIGSWLSKREDNKTQQNQQNGSVNGN